MESNVWRKKDPKRAALHMKQWRERHPEVWKANRRRYRKKHSAEILLRNRQRTDGTVGPYKEEDGDDWKEKNKEHHRRLSRERNAKNRAKATLEAIDAYGGKCFCCGETEPVFLVLDHINGGGRKHRKEIGGHIATWAKRNGWPKSLRLACHNCNFALFAHKGVCPHMLKKLEVA